MTSFKTKQPGSDSPDPDPAQLLKGINQIHGQADTGLAWTKRPLPPVHLWNPAFCGDLPMVIKRDGTWLYQGSPIGRKRMVQLFSSILRRDEDGRYYLVTPAEKCGIVVEDAPFVAVEVKVEGKDRDQILSFRTHVDDWAVADESHPIRMDIDPENDQPAPYIHIRGRLEALINRAVYYELVELGTVEKRQGEPMFGVWSRGQFFAFAPADQVLSS